MVLCYYVFRFFARTFSPKSFFLLYQLESDMFVYFCLASSKLLVIEFKIHNTNTCIVRFEICIPRSSLEGSLEATTTYIFDMQVFVFKTLHDHLHFFSNFE